MLLENVLCIGFLLSLICVSATQSKLTHLHAQITNKNEEPDSGEDLKAKLNQIQELKNDIHKLKTDSHNAKEKLEANIILERSKTEKCCQEKEASEGKLNEKIEQLEAELQRVSDLLTKCVEEKKETGNLLSFENAFSTAS